jgi:hypothetical protein
MVTSSMPWVKIYNEIIDDAKVGGLTDSCKWRFIQLIVLAGEFDQEGIIPLSDIQLSWRLRIDKDILAKDTQAMLEMELIEVGEMGFLIKNFSKRQGRPQSVKREQWRKAQESHRKGVEPVINESYMTPPDSHTGVILPEEEEEEDKREPEAGARAPGGSDAKKRGDILDGILAFQTPPAGVDLSWLDEYFIPRALAFWQETKIAPMPDERSFWRKELKAQYEAGITAKQIKTACQQMRKDGLTIKSPASIRAVARDIPKQVDAEHIPTFY